MPNIWNLFICILVYPYGFAKVYLMYKFKHLKSQKIPLIIALILLAVGGLILLKKSTLKSLPQTGPSEMSSFISQDFFNCDDKKYINASIYNNFAAVILSDGRNLTLPKVDSGSGVRYANTDESFVFWNKGNTAFIQEGQQTTYADCIKSDSSESSSKGQVTVSGEMVCLPHKDQKGPQTLECAYGLKAGNGTYYALQDQDPMYKNISGIPMNKKVEVTGSIELKEDSKYDTIGLITITSIKQL